MSVIINASTSSGLTQTADNSGTLELQSNGTTQLTVSSTGTYGQLKRATAQASTSGTSIDFTSIPSWVKRITVMLSGVSTNGTGNLRLQIGDSGGIETSSYDSAGCYINSAGVADSSTSTSGFDAHGDNAGTAVRNGLIQLINLSGNVWVAAGNFNSSSSSFGISGSKTLSDTLTQVRVTTTNGTDTFDAGSINILYEG